MSSQAEHDQLHPGARCKNCPVEVAHRAWMDEMIIRAAKPTVWDRLWILLAFLFLLLAVFMLSANGYIRWGWGPEHKPAAPVEVRDVEAL